MKERDKKKIQSHIDEMISGVMQSSIGAFVRYYLKSAQARPDWEQFQEKLTRLVKELRAGGPEAGDTSLQEINQMAACLLHVVTSSVVEHSVKHPEQLAEIWNALRHGDTIELDDEPEKEEDTVQQLGVFLGVPVGTAGYTPGTDYQVETCNNCPTQIWIGPVQRKTRDDLPFDKVTLCPLCAFNRYGAKALTENNVVVNKNADSKFNEDIYKRIWK